MKLTSGLTLGRPLFFISHAQNCNVWGPVLPVHNHVVNINFLISIWSKLSLLAYFFIKFYHNIFDSDNNCIIIKILNGSFLYLNCTKIIDY